MPRPAPASVNAASVSIRPRTKPPSAPITPNPPAESAGPPGPRGLDSQYGGPATRLDTQAPKNHLAQLPAGSGPPPQAELSPPCRPAGPASPSGTRLPGLR